VLYHYTNYDGAAQEFDVAAKAAAQAAMPQANLGMTYLALGQDKKAIEHATRSLQLGRNEDAYLTLGDVAFKGKQFSTALENYQRAAALNPNNPMTWRNIGDCYTILGNPAQVRNNYAKAAKLLSEKMATNPRSGSGWAELAFYHAKIGDIADAQEDIKNAESRLRIAETQGKNDVESQFMIAQALAVLGKKEEALQLLLTCIDSGLSLVEVNLALDLKGICQDPRYISHLSKIQAKRAPAGK
jgi:tetratricopeptide (TPR) repeat protein